MSKFDVEKPKPRKGLSYALKTSLLKEAVAAAGIDCAIHLRYRTPLPVPGGATILEAFYWLPNENVDHDRFYVRAGTVAPGERKAAENLLRERVIPSFVEWAAKIQSLPPGSTRRKHNLYFNAVFEDGEVGIYRDEV